MEGRREIGAVGEGVDAKGDRVQLVMRGAKSEGRLRVAGGQPLELVEEQTDPLLGEARLLSASNHSRQPFSHSMARASSSVERVRVDAGIERAHQPMWSVEGTMEPPLLGKAFVPIPPLAVHGGLVLFILVLMIS